MSSKVIVKYNGGGWYSFSPSGHASYSRKNDIKIQGLQKCINLLNDFKVIGYLNNNKRLN